MNRTLLTTTAIAMTLAATSARGAYRADFFSTRTPARVAFDPAASAWTLSNGSVSRTVRFDAQAGGLVPGDLKRDGYAAAARVASEGEILLESPSAAPPVPLTGWRMSEAAPQGDWTSADYDDSAWKATSLPFRTNTENRSWWFRARVPDGALAGDQRPVLVLDHAVDEAAEVYADGKRLATLDPANQSWTKTVTVDLPANARVIAIRLDGLGQPNGLAGAGLAEGGRARTLRLDRGWTLAGHTEKGNELTIRLAGEGENAGFTVAARYRIMAGDEPVITKSFTVTNASGQDYLLAGTVLDRVEAVRGALSEQTFLGSGRAVSAKDGSAGFAIAVMSYQGATDSEEGGRRVASVWRPSVPLPSGAKVETPDAVLGLYAGGTPTGAFLLQLYVGAHVSHATPTTVPPLYNTWFGYYNTIDAETVKQVIPIAASLGVKTFVIDDGWQALADGKTPGYGDWVTNTARFPEGIKPLSEMARKHGLRFGMWTAPIMVQNTSEIVKQHPEWLIKRADGSRLPLWGDSSAMCFSGAYAEQYKRKLVAMCKEYHLGFVKIDGGLFVDGCIAPNHGHPVGHSEAAQIAAWEDLVTTLRREIPGIIVNRGWEGEPGLTAFQDSSWFGDWALAFHPEREADIKWWYRNADIYRNGLYNLTFTRPSFTVSWEAPGHILAKPIDLNALEYHITSVGAWVCNMEIHGRIGEMTPEEGEIVRKWVKWNADNRDWLAFSQPLVSLGRPYDPMAADSVKHVDGVLHLRNALRGRYGYVCLWNPSEEPATARVPVHPADYFVKMDTATVRAIRYKDGQPVEMARAEDGITLTVPMAPLSWEIIELREQ